MQAGLAIPGLALSPVMAKVAALLMVAGRQLEKGAC